ncbi:MAG: hypothetical protein ABIQ95_09390 [Bdellovibrionia bacterium]
MSKNRDTFFNTEDLNFQMNYEGLVEMSAGLTHLNMSLDFAYELQFKLATFLANLELKEQEEGEIRKDVPFFESQSLLHHLSSHNELRRLDS